MRNFLENRVRDWSVYVLVSESQERTYVGIALDTERRLAQHNGELSGGARSTRAGRPWCIAATYGPFATRAQAQSVEYELKRRTALARLEWDGYTPQREELNAPEKKPASRGCSAR